MFHRVKSLGKVHGKESHCFTVIIIQVFADLVLNSWERRCTVLTLSLRELSAAQVILQDASDMCVVYSPFKGPSNHQCYTDSTEITILHRYVNLRKWTDVCSYPRFRPGMSCQGEIPHIKDSWG